MSTPTDWRSRGPPAVDESVSLPEQLSKSRPLPKLCSSPPRSSVNGADATALGVRTRDQDEQISPQIIMDSARPMLDSLRGITGESPREDELFRETPSQSHGASKFYVSGQRIVLSEVQMSPRAKAISQYTRASSELPKNVRKDPHQRRNEHGSPSHPLSAGKREAPASASGSDEDEDAAAAAAAAAASTEHPTTQQYEHVASPSPTTCYSTTPSSSDFSLVSATPSPTRPPSTPSDTGYESVSSPGGSSTSSGHICVLRQPGWDERADAHRRPRQKKKKLQERPPEVRSTTGSHVGKSRRGARPMRERAFPESFWTNPNKPDSFTPGVVYRKLPPLVCKDDDSDRPVNASSASGERVARPSVAGEWHITESEESVDSLRKLFENVDVKPHKPGGRANVKPPSSLQQRSFRSPAILQSGGDPYLAESVTERLFPELAAAGRTKRSQLSAFGAGDSFGLQLPNLGPDSDPATILAQVVKQL